MITIFSNRNLTKTQGERSESGRVSYWLEKLFKQGEKRIADEKKEKSFRKGPTSPDGDMLTQDPTEETIREEDEGKEEAIKNHFRKIGTDQHRLDDMMAKSNRIIISITSVFPWDLFPDSINVEETRVTVIQRQLFASQVHSVDIKNISNVFIDEDLFLAAITIVSRTFEENKIKIMKLRKKEADLTRRLIEGLRMFIEKDIDTSKYTTEQLVIKLKELSTTKTVF